MKMIDETAYMTAKFLLQIKAVKLNDESPFTWASGRKSPIYCDNRITLSYPEIRTFIRQRFVDSILEQFGDVDVIAGVATGGIAQGAFLRRAVNGGSLKHGEGGQGQGDSCQWCGICHVVSCFIRGASSLKWVSLYSGARARHRAVSSAGVVPHAALMMGTPTLWQSSMSEGASPT